MSVKSSREDHFSRSHHVGFVGKALAFVLFLILFLQPVGTVLAAEDAVLAEETEIPAQNDEAPIPVELEAEEEPFVVEENSSEASSEALAEESSAVSDTTESTEIAGVDPNLQIPQEDVLPESVDETEDVVVSTGDLEDISVSNEETATSTEEVIEDVVVSEDFATTSIEVPQVSEEEVLEVEVPDATTTSEVSTTTEVTVEMPLANVMMNDGNRYQFGVDDCIAMEGGFFYCTKPDEPERPVVKDGVYAAQDADGDLEIFITKNGESFQVTHNLYDDSAPQYDPRSDRVVWHSLIDDRYQIMSYDLESGDITQITNTTYNNMEPSIEGDIMVWQSWLENDWEIMLDINGERSRLSDNDGHDVDPYIRGDLVSWQSDEGGAWQIKVFDRTTGKIDTIDTEGGASAKNPRYLLVYDSVDQNGDIATVGYDLEEGVSVPLAATPAPLPAEIPEPEHEKEERALVQPSPNIKEETDLEDDEGAPAPPALPAADDLETGTSTLVIGSSTEAMSTEVVEPPFEPLDLRQLTPNESSLISPVAHIPDLVIVSTSSNDMETGE